MASSGLLSYSFERELPKRGLDFPFNNTEAATTISAVSRTCVSQQYFSVIKRNIEKCCICVQAYSSQGYCCYGKAGRARVRLSLRPLYEIKATSIYSAIAIVRQQPPKVSAPMCTRELQ